MIKNVSLAALLLALAACAYKLPEELVLKIFERHSFAAHDAQLLRTLLREKGAEGLRAADPYAQLLRSGRSFKTYQAQPEPWAGLLLGRKGGDHYLLKVFKGSAAGKAGLREGDLVLAVNDAVPGTTAFTRELSGGRGFRVRAARRAREGLSGFEAEVRPAPLGLPPVFGFYEPAAAAAFVRIGLFFEGSADLAAAGLDALLKSGAKNLILDLRGNRGGDPGEAAALLKLFAPKAGPLLGLASRHQGYAASFSAPGRGRFAGLRCALLVDGETSMAAEVFAASLKELAGASVTGARTAGKVSVQKAFSLGEGRGLSLTVARLVTSSGRDLEGAGLEPDQAAASGKEPAWSSVDAGALLGDEAYLRALEALGAAPVAKGPRP